MSLVPSIPGLPTSTEVVSSKILVDGTVLSGEYRIHSLAVSKAFNRIATACVTLFDGSAADRDFEISNEDTFKPGNTLEIQLGYHGTTETVFKGIIIRHGIKASQGKASLLKIEAKDEAIRLTLGRKNRTFVQKTDSDVFQSIADEASVDIDLADLTAQSPAFTHPQLVQYNCTDWDFIVSRAEMNGMLVCTDDNTVTLKKPSTSGETVVQATYGNNVFEFENEIDARHQSLKVTSRSWSPANQQTEDADKDAADFEENGNLSASDVADTLGQEITQIHTGDLTESQLQRWSEAAYLKQVLGKSYGRVKVQGIATVKPGTVIELQGMGDRFNGKVWVTGCLHQLDRNWKTDIQFGWSDDWFIRKNNVMEKPASGMLPGVTGLQIGVVDDFATDDTGNFRVKVKLPLAATTDPIWARLATLDAGKDRGTFFRPEKDDEVILGFLNDDPREAVVLGAVHSQKNAAPLTPASDNKEKGYVSREKLKIVLNDGDKSITFSTPGNRTVTLDDTAGTIQLKDGSGNEITLDSTGITIQTSGTLTLKGTTVQIN